MFNHFERVAYSFSLWKKLGSPANSGATGTCPRQLKRHRGPVKSDFGCRLIQPTQLNRYVVEAPRRKALPEEPHTRHDNFHNVEPDVGPRQV